jgi:hypothetical protein
MDGSQKLDSTPHEHLKCFRLKRAMMALMASNGTVAVFEYFQEN